MRFWILLAFLLMVPVVLASQEAEDIFASEVVNIDVTISSDLDVKAKQKGKAVSIEYVQADLFFYPKEDVAQQVLSLTTSPKATKRGEALRFRWEDQTKGLDFSASSSVKVRNFFPRVTKKIKFPLTAVPPEAREYLDPSEHIDSRHTSIVNLANKLAQGKDDLWIVVSDIAIWTKNNIEYNLSTLTADVSQKASWVLENRNGVCDELTSLFIAMLRALGIPARFVTGMSYTASPQFPEQWGAHGWAEVYFPGVGWVPFDPTFGEFGWVDPGHIKMMTSADPSEASTKFEWRGINADLEFSEPQIDATITSVGRRLPPIVDIDVEPLYDEVGFGSYNLVKATIENLQSYYLTTEVRLARVIEMDTLEPYAQQVVLKPRQKKTIFWRVQVSPNLLEKYLYTVPVAVFTVQNYSSYKSFTARSRGAEHAKYEVTRAMNTLADEEEATISKSLSLECDSDRTFLYPDETAEITCVLRNLGNTPLVGLRTCVDQTNCKAIDMGISQDRELTFEQKYTKPGPTTLFVTSSNADVTRTAPLSMIMNDFPSIEIIEIEAPEEVKYGKEFNLVFVLKPTSVSTPKNIHAIVSTPVGGSVFKMPELPGEQAFEVGMHAKELSLGVTDITIDVVAQDDLGREYSFSATKAVELTDVPWYAKSWLWFRGLFE